jgi:glycine/D-amino acid oxidase-like deaminating enzyme
MSQPLGTEVGGVLSICREAVVGARCDQRGWRLMGCATATYLVREAPTLDVLIVEPNPSYTLAATPRASGGIRLLFTCPRNVAIGS